MPVFGIHPPGLLQTIFEDIGTAVAVVDRQEHIVFANRPALELFRVEKTDTLPTFRHWRHNYRFEDLVYSRMKEKYPKIQVLKRPSNRPFAGISTHDPAGNVFDLSQLNMENRRDLYTEKVEERKRRIGHFALRCVEPEQCAEFYREVFELTELEKPSGDPNHYLSDGRVTLAIMPWKIGDFYGSGIERPALDHIGFKVESMAAFKADLEKSAHLLPREDRPDKNPEREVRQKLLATCCFGQFQLADPDGVLIDVSEN